LGARVPAFLIQVAGTSVLLGTADDSGAQQACNPTASTTMASGVIGPVSMPLYLVNEGVAAQATIYGFTLTNVLPNEAPGTLAGTLDAREIYGLFTDLPGELTPESVCGVLGQVGSPCAACGDGQPYCVAIAASDPKATASAVSMTTIAAGAVPATCTAPATP
jgi:hypothetical protein